jgi:hypothetical protein
VLNRSRRRPQVGQVLDVPVMQHSVVCLPIGRSTRCVAGCLAQHMRVCMQVSWCSCDATNPDQPFLHATQKTPARHQASARAAAERLAAAAMSAIAPLHRSRQHLQCQAHCVAHSDAMHDRRPRVPSELQVSRPFSCCMHMPTGIPTVLSDSSCSSVLAHTLYMCAAPLQMTANQASTSKYPCLRDPTKVQRLRHC